MTCEAYIFQKKYDIIVIGDYMLKEYRLKRGFSLEKLAEITGISWRNLQRIENGKDKDAKFETIKKLIKALNVDEKDIINYIKK